jgi:hypothetical protein
MAKTYPGQDSGGTHNTTVSAPPASGPTRILTYQGPTVGNQWNYSTAVNGTTTFYVVIDGPTLGRHRSAT